MQESRNTSLEFGRRKRLLFAIIVIGAGLEPARTASAQQAPHAAAHEPTSPAIVEAYALYPMPIGKTFNAILPGAIENDRHINIGGLSDLWRGTGDAEGEFWTITDRAPNGSET